MNNDNLVQMANRIGQFFDAMPDHAEAVDGVTQHIRRYWEPRMRQQLLVQLRSHGGEGLHPLVAEAAQRLS